MIDLQRFCASADDEREYLRAPMRVADSIAATDGHIMVYIPDDGRECAAHPEKVHFGRYAAVPESLPDGVPVASIKLPEANKCVDCEGAGRVERKQCEDCDGAGEFTRGRHDYTCQECDGAGYVPHPGNGSQCGHCSGSGVGRYQGVQVGCTLIDHRFLSLLLTLPDCVIYPNGWDSAAWYTFTGGHGVVMPMRK